MKLNQFLEQLHELFPGILDDNFGEPPILMGNNLKKELIYDKLVEVDEFKQCNFKILQTPEQTTTLLLREGMTFKEIKLYKIHLTPLIYDPKCLDTPVKDGCLISPLTYDPDKFTPIKTIIIQYSPEGDDDEKVKQEIRKKLNDILENPKDYQVKGFKGILLTGQFNYLAPEKSESVRVYLK